MAQIVEAINEVYNVDKIHDVKLFLAGGITNCPDWQSELIEKIKDVKHLVIYNPRRANFPIGDPSAAEQQIVWEAEHLKDADLLVFWFAKGSLNPIVLLEFGKYGLSSTKNIIMGIDPEYERKQDVVIQTMIARPDVQAINETIDQMADQIKDSMSYRDLQYNLSYSE